MWQRICDISPLHLTCWVSKQSFCIFTSLSLTIHIPHAILTHVAFNDCFTNQVFVTFNELYFTPGTATICRTDVRYLRDAAASVWTKDSKRCYFVRGGCIFNTRLSKSWRCKRSGWRKTVTVSDSLGRNVINCKWTGAWYFKNATKTALWNSYFVISSLKSSILIILLKILFTQFIFKKRQNIFFQCAYF